jgi:hypothetical protein
MGLTGFSMLSSPKNYHNTFGSSLLPFFQHYSYTVIILSCRFRELGKKIFYVTNNSTKHRKEYMKKFQSLGFGATMVRFLVRMHRILIWPNVRQI